MEEKWVCIFITTLWSKLLWLPFIPFIGPWQSCHKNHSMFGLSSTLSLWLCNYQHIHIKKCQYFHSISNTWYIVIILYTYRALSERHTYYTLNVTGVEITHLETRCIMQYNIVWHVLYFRLFAYCNTEVLYKTEQKKNVMECSQSPATWTAFDKLKFLFQHQAFFQSTIKKLSKRNTNFISVLSYMGQQ